MTYYNNLINGYLRLTVAVCLSLIPCPFFAQRNQKYENVVKKAEEAAPDEAFGMYAEYLGANPLSERANLYFKLAELASELMKTLDPLDGYGEIKALRNQSREYYMACEKYLNDDNVRKDQLYYSGVQASRRRLAASDVALHIQRKREVDSLFFENARFVVETYASMLDSYYRCVDLYREICDNNRGHSESVSMYSLPLNCRYGGYETENTMWPVCQLTLYHEDRSVRAHCYTCARCCFLNPFPKINSRKGQGVVFSGKQR